MNMKEFTHEGHIYFSQGHSMKLKVRLGQTFHIDQNGNHWNNRTGLRVNHQPGEDAARLIVSSLHKLADDRVGVAFPLTHEGIMKGKCKTGGKLAASHDLSRGRVVMLRENKNWWTDDDGRRFSKRDGWAMNGEYLRISLDSIMAMPVHSGVPYKIMREHGTLKPIE